MSDALERKMKGKVVKFYDQFFPSDLKVDPDVQRAFDQRLAARLEERWDPQMVGTIKVSKRRNGDLYIIDGQHRVVVAGRKDPTYVLDCEVYEGLSTRDEARMFIAANRVRKNVPAFDDFRIGLKARLWEELEMDRQTRACGLELGRSASTNVVGAVQACRRIVVKDKKTKIGLLRVTLRTCQSAWGNDKDSWDNTVIQAISVVIYMNRDNIDMKRLVTVLGKSMPFQWIAQAMATVKSGGGSVSRSNALARNIVLDYNRGLRAESKHIK